LLFSLLRINVRRDCKNCREHEGKNAFPHQSEGPLPGGVEQIAHLNLW